MSVEAYGDALDSALREIARLNAECASLRAERDALQAALSASCAEERAQLWEACTGGGCSRALDAEKERDALRADAERYRWLRDSYYGPDKGAANRAIGHCTTAAALDAAIDAARAQEKP